MADEELPQGGEEQAKPESEAEGAKQAGSSPGEANAAAAGGGEPEVAVDQVSDQGTGAGPDAQAAGAEVEGQSVDDLVEQQMLAELEKLESEDKSTGQANTLADSGLEEINEMDVRRPDFPNFAQKSTSAVEQKNLNLLLDVNLPISIELGRTTMRIKEILNLGPGSVVELKKLAGEPVDLLVNNKIVAKGEVVVVDENFGLRITSLLSTEERLRSLE